MVWLPGGETTLIICVIV